MCGIAGIVRLEREAPPATREEALAMARRIRHRGPDGQAAWVSPSGSCALGHARLKVIDLETGDQPMGSGNGAVQVVFNGEIYNFRALRSELEAKGRRFRTRSDTEVLVHGWSEWGESLPERLDGMFAFAVWDEAAGRLFLARDRAGKKPLFWARQGGRLAFASEIKALLALPWVPDEMDEGALPFYLAYGYVPGPRTFLRGIEALPPATAMTVDGARQAQRRYWTLDWRRGADIGDEEAIARVRSLLRDAVERRLVADVPLGAFLSGGIDSTLIVGLMRERIEGPLRTFSLGFADDATYDETPFARAAARRFGTEHTEFIVEAHAVELVDELVEAYDGPFGDSSAIPTHIVSRLTREHVTVALTGDGGDEMFCGYPRFLGMAVAERVGRGVAALGDAVGRRLPHHPDFRHPLRRFQRFFAAAALAPEERMLRWIGYLPEVERYLRPELASAVDRRALTESFRVPWERERGQSSVTRALALNFETYLPDDLLVKADRCSMAHGLELRAPFLDTAVMEFAAGLPDRLRHRGRTLKWLLKRAFPDLLPPEIARRGKWGFGVPLPVWFRTHWRPLFESRVLAPEARIRAWLDPEPVARLWAEHLGGGADHGHALWALLTLETWLRRRG
ncbi:MAG TPA: asparagine synthase (glutamine-hydrolyzing) [Longimicrobiales bacterium]|nr:asparagine synthase (glutamine-hydrolyzing) [Longimicrobiales bacterium]